MPVRRRNKNREEIDHNVAGGDAVTWGHPQHRHNSEDGGLSRIVSSSGSLLG